MAAERYLSRRIPDLRVGNNIGKIDKKPVPVRNPVLKTEEEESHYFAV